MSQYNQNRNENIVEINVVPLVDIVLVILIIFMVSAPIFMKPSIQVNLPKVSSASETESKQISITISKNGVIDCNGEAIGISQLESHLMKVEADKESGVVIAADKEVQHGTVIKVIDVLKSLGVSKFSLSVDSEEHLSGQPLYSRTLFI